MATPRTIAFLKKGAPAAGRRTPKSERKIPKVIGSSEQTFVTDAVALMTNNAVKVVSEAKGRVDVKVQYPVALMEFLRNALRGMFSSGREYVIQVHQAGNIQSDAGGGTVGFVAISPSVASYGEWSALAALFDEVKAHSTQLTLACTQTLQVAAGKVMPSMVVAIDEQDLSTDPSSYISVFRLAGSRAFNGMLCTGGSGCQRFSHTFASRSWCDTAVPYSQSPIGGMIGCWVYANNGIWPVVSTQVYTFSSITVVRLRCRA